MLIGEARLVGVGVDDVDPHLATPTVGSGSRNGIADTAVHQPAWSTLVKALAPSSIKLPSGGQGSVEILAVLHSLFIGEAIVVACEKDLTLESDGRI